MNLIVIRLNNFYYLTKHPSAGVRAVGQSHRQQQHQSSLHNRTLFKH